MEYKYGKAGNYEDFSSGRVLYHVNGMTNFPVRLAQEIYGRCLQYSPKKSNITLYDCCCGGGYLLTIIGFLNQDTIGRIIGSDINENMLHIAKKNLSLLSKDGISKRIIEIDEMIENFQKESHIEAKNSAIRLKGLIRNDIEYAVFQADALKAINLEEAPDIIVTDVPYGNMVAWTGDEENLIDKLLNVLYSISSPNTIIGLCMDKKQKVRNEKFIRLEKQQVGKRRFEILKIKF
jgi:tRNA G10  N-methylase Trm11